MDSMDHLMVRSLQGRATPGEKERLLVWRQASPENEQRYEEVTALWGLTGLVGASAPSSPPPPVRDLLGGAAQRRRRIPPASHSASPFLPTRHWFPWIGIATAALGLVAVLDVARRGAGGFAPMEFANHGDRVDTLRLPDGSAVRLGPGARLRAVGVGGRRDAELEGHAEFAVVRGAPFTVRTAAGTVEVRGTRFVVRAQQGTTQLLVIEGRVAAWARGGADTVVVEPGQTSALVPGRRPIVIAFDRTRSADAWLRAALVFESAPLEQVAAVIAHRYGLHVTFADSGLRRRTVTAWFNTEPTPVQVLRGVCRAVGTACRITDTGAIIGAR